MSVKIRSKLNNEIIISGEYESIKDALQKNYDANLRGANLRGANLRDANLRGANLRGANLRDADLCGADLCGANLCGADLRDANLCGANLRGASLRGSNLRDADLRGANLRDANLCDAVYIHIKGSSFDLYCIGNYVQIGCEKHDIDWWEKNGKKLAENNNFTKDQIKEYKKYIDICVELNKKQGE